MEAGAGTNGSRRECTTARWTSAQAAPSERGRALPMPSSSGRGLDATHCEPSGNPGFSRSVPPTALARGQQLDLPAGLAQRERLRIGSRPAGGGPAVDGVQLAARAAREPARPSGAGRLAQPAAEAAVDLDRDPGPPGLVGQRRAEANPERRRLDQVARPGGVGGGRLGRILPGLVHAHFYRLARQGAGVQAPCERGGGLGRVDRRAAECPVRARLVGVVVLGHQVGLPIGL